MSSVFENAPFRVFGEGPVYMNNFKLTYKFQGLSLKKKKAFSVQRFYFPFDINKQNIQILLGGMCGVHSCRMKKRLGYGVLLK